MQFIQLQATESKNFQFPETVEIHMAKPLDHAVPDLDDALALVVQAVHQGAKPEAMMALQTLLSYMENLEKKQAHQPSADSWVKLSHPLTLTF